MTGSRVLVLLVAAAVVFAAWGIVKFVDRPTRGPTQAVVSGPCLPQGSLYRKRVDSSMTEFLDAMKVAEVSPRITLGARVERLQQIKREFEATASPPCASTVREEMLEAMGAQIDGYLAFMADAGQPGLQSAVAARERATAAWKRFGVALAGAAEGAPSVH